MDSIYALTEWDKTRIAILKQERDRLWKQIDIIENEIHRIFERTPITISFDDEDEDDRKILERFKAAGVITEVDNNDSL